MSCVLSFLGEVILLIDLQTLNRLYVFLKVKVLVTLSCPALGNPMDYTWPDSSVHGTSQARILEWAAIPFSRGSPDPGI